MTTSNRSSSGQTNLEETVNRIDLQRRLDVSSETMRRWLKTGKLPPLDFDLSFKTQGWKRSTLLAAGIRVV